MNHKASIYSNPSIPAGLYFAKLLDVHLEESDHPYLWASLLTGPAYGEYSGMKLSAILYLTPKSQELLNKFRTTFRVSGPHCPESYLDALGRWGCVSVFPSAHQMTEFSCVSFVNQNARMMFTSLSLEKKEQKEEKAERGWLE